MKQVSYIAFLIAIVIAIGAKQSLAQTVLYNGGTDITADIGSIIYVDGDIENSSTGAIHNQGDIYLTRDWTNNAASGCLDPTTGTVYLDGTIQTIMGTQITTFNNLNCLGTGLKTLNINTIVGGNSGVLSLNNSPFDLNSNMLIVTNPLNGAITRNNGYIISETDFTAGYGIVQWNLGNSTGNYIYPFGTVGGTYIPFICNITTAGVQSTTGNMAVATYPTNVVVNPNNLPYPSGVLNLNDASGNDASLICLDRFWITTPNNYTTSPVADASFYYAEPEWDNSAGSTNTIVEDSLMAWRWNGTQWLNPSTGTDNSAANNVAVSSVNTFSIWTLKGAPPCAVAVTMSSTQTGCTTSDGTATATPSGGTPSYTYSWTGGQTTQTATGLGAGTYTVTVIDMNGCTQIQTVMVTQSPAPTALANATLTTITLGDNTVVQITASGGGTYLWSPSGETTSSISVSPTSTTQYCVTATDLSTGCADSTCVTISVELPCGKFFLPNAFSPNGDGKNDFFKPRNICIKEITFKIYNRWGNLVFETSEVGKGWDGSTPKGKDGNEGVYAYDVKATLNDGTAIDQKGTVTLMK